MFDDFIIWVRYLITGLIFIYRIILFLEINFFIINNFRIANIISRPTCFKLSCILFTDFPWPEVRLPAIAAKNSRHWIWRTPRGSWWTRRPRPDRTMVPTWRQRCPARICSAANQLSVPRLQWRVRRGGKGAGSQGMVGCVLGFARGSQECRQESPGQKVGSQVLCLR